MAKRLGKEDWIAFALKELARNGHSSLNGAGLAKKLNVSRGSFYWHFKDIANLKKCVLDRWKQVSTEDVIVMLQSRIAPRLRLKHLIEKAMGTNRSLERSIRSWSAQDRTVANYVNSVDQTRIDYITSLLRRMNVPKSQIRARALTLYWASLGRLMIDSRALISLSDSEINQLFKLFISK